MSAIAFYKHHHFITVLLALLVILIGYAECSPVLQSDADENGINYHHPSIKFNSVYNLSRLNISYCLKYIEAADSDESLNEVRPEVDYYQASSRSFTNSTVEKIVNKLNKTYNLLNSQTGRTNLDTLTAALTRLSSSQGYFAFLNYLFTVSNVAQTYGGIIAGVTLKDAKKARKEDSISGAEVSDKLQSSVDDLNDRLSSSTDVISKLFYCTYLNGMMKSNKFQGRRLKLYHYCSQQLDDLENQLRIV